MRNEVPKFSFGDDSSTRASAITLNDVPPPGGVVAVAVAVGVPGVAVPLIWMTSCGRCDVGPSLEVKSAPSEESACSAKLSVPLAVTMLVTSYSTHVPTLVVPMSPTTVPVAGLLFQLMAVSDQELSATRNNFGPFEVPF